MDFKKQDLMIQEDVENTADEEDDTGGCEECFHLGCPSEKMALCDKLFKVKESPTLRCGRITHKIYTKNSNLCVPKNYGYVTYTGESCGANTGMEYVSDGITYHAQNIKWVSAKADDIPSGMSEAQCEWTWGADHGFYAGSCGVKPQVATSPTTRFPETCWPDEIAEERASAEKERVRGLKAQIAKLVAPPSPENLGPAEGIVQVPR